MPPNVQCLYLEAARSTAISSFNMSARVKSGTEPDAKRQLAPPGEAGAWRGVESILLASPRKRNLVVGLLLAVVTFALYSPTIGHPFIFNYDDDTYVIDNSHVHAGLVWTTARWALTSTEGSNWHPLTWLSHALDCQLYGLNPAGHHVTNVLFHLLNAVLLFLLLARATGAAGRSLLVAALFAVHPFNVESVAWIAERKNVLSTLFFLLTLAAYGWYALKPTVGRYCAVAALFVLGLASKPMVITLPCVLLLLDFWPLRRVQGWEPAPPKLSGSKDKDPEGLRSNRVDFRVPQTRFLRLVLEKFPLIALSAASGAITIFAQRSGGSMRLVLPLSVRLENAIYAYAMYVWKAFWPVRLAVFYPHPGAALAVWRFALAALFVLSVSALVWLQRDARPYLVTGWLWFLGTLVPVIGLIQVGEQAMADRYAYIPLIGIFLMAVWGASDLADRWQISFRARAKTAAIVLVILAIFTSDQIRYWRSANDLWAHAVDVTKDNFVAEENLGVALIASDHADEALPHLQNAVRIKPSSSASHLTLAGVLALNGRPRDSIAEYETAIPGTSDPRLLVVAYETLGRLYAEAGNYSKARTNFEQALRIDPQRQSSRDGLAKVEFSDTIRNVAEAPSAEAYLRLGRLLQRGDRIPEARSAYQQALHLDPKLGEAQKALDSLNSGGK
jgi:tetratricopeptide (TPR) repeat protein